jgi:1-acyl-sn-glycerol-3-phosphate acyltransferase
MRPVREWKEVGLRVLRECYGARVAQDESMAERVDRLELPFNEFGVDPYGISKKHLALAASVMAALYRYYFRVRCYGIEHVPARGRAMLVGNHSGGYAIDGAMVVTSMLLEMDPPRLAQGMAEKFINRLPVASLWTSRTGQFTGLPEHALRLLEDDRLLMVFPEGARGTAKLYKERYSLVDFGTGFIRLALQTRTPIVPVGILGGGTAVPTVANLYRLGRLVGVPYIPVTPYLLPLPLPAPVELYYGEPLVFSGTGGEDDEVIAGYVEQVKSRIAGLIEQGREQRNRRRGA